MPEKVLYEFGHFLLDPSQPVLLRDGQRVHLYPKTLLLLQTLIEADGCILSKDDLMVAVWPEAVVEENNLTKNISQLRKALSNGSESEKFIETIPTIGYRFAGHVTSVAETNGWAEHNGAQSGALPLPLTSEVRAPAVIIGISEQANNKAKLRREKPLKIAAIALGLCVIVSAMLIFIAGRRSQLSRDDNRPRPSAASIAVLPFQNLTGDAAQDYFTDGLAEDLTNDLSRIKDLTVISRNSAFTFKGQQVDVREVGRKLNVAAVLAGTVQRRGTGWQIAITLRDTQNGRQLWRSEHHDRPLADIFTIQHEIRCNVAANLQVVLCGDESDKKQTNNLDAYLAYLKGLYQFNLRTSESLRQAINHFERAVALDPNYAEAWASLSNAYYIGRWYIPLSNEITPKIGAAAQRAVALDDSSAQAHLALARYFSSQEQEAEANREVERIKAVNPNLPQFLHSEGITKALLGQYDKGIGLIHQAQRLDPLSLVINTDVGYVYYIARHHDEAVAAYRSALAMDPKFSLAHLLLGLALSTQGKHAEAIAEVQQATERGSEHLAALGNVQALAGQRREALETLEKLRRLAQRQFVPPYQFAWIYCGLGDLDQAIKSLQESARQKVGVIDFKHHPIYEPLQSDARYQDLLKQAAYPW